MAKTSARPVGTWVVPAAAALIAAAAYVLVSMAVQETAAASDGTAP